MNTVAVIIKSQFMRLWRSKSLLAVALIGPLLVMLLMGIAFGNTSVYALKVGYYVPQKSNLTDDVLGSLQASQMLLQSYDSEAACSDAVRSGESHACLVFSSPFAPAGNNVVTIVVDGSNLALAGIVSEGIYGTLENKSAALGTDIASKLVGVIETVRQRATASKTSIVKLTTDSNSALQNVKASEGGVQSLDTSFSVSGISTDTIALQNSLLLNATTAAMESTSGTLQGVLAAIASANNALNATNISATNKTYLYAQLTNISSLVNTTLNTLQSLDQSSNASFAAVDGSLTIIAGQISAISSQVDAIVAAKTGISSNLAGVDANLNDALVDIASLQQSVDAIATAVNTITVTNPSLVSRPFTAIVRPLPVPSKLSSLYPALLVLVVAFGGLLIAPRLVHMDRHSGAQMRLSLIPSSREVQAIATIATGAVLIAAQALVLVVVSWLLFPQAAPFSTFIILVLTGLLFVLLGNAISYFFSTEEAAMLATLTVGTALLLLAGIIIPVEYMPDFLRTLVAYNPVLIAASAIRQTAVFGLSSASGFFGLLLGIIVAALLAYGALLLSRTYSVEGLFERMNRK